MNTVAFPQEAGAASSEAGLPLRLAQRAFAALLEDRALADVANLAAFRAAQLRSGARRTLSDLSADEETVLQRWLSLQLATRHAGATDALRHLTRVDAALAAAVASSLAGTRKDLAGHEPATAVVAA